MKHSDLSGCMLCGDDYEHGDEIRVWESSYGPRSVHERCWQEQTTKGDAYRRKTWPKISAAPVTTFDANAPAMTS